MIRLLCLLLCLAGAASARDSIVTSGPLTDEEFFNLVSCGATPGGACRRYHMAWSKADARDLTIGIVQVQDRYPTRIRASVEDAVAYAVDHLNAQNAGVRLRLVAGNADPDIRVFLVSARGGQAMKGTGYRAFDGRRIGNAIVHVRPKPESKTHARIEYAGIAFQSRLDRRKARSIALEEIYQALGFMFDISNRHYRNVSIIDDQGSGTDVLGPQDIKILHMKYP